MAARRRWLPNAPVPIPPSRKLHHHNLYASLDEDDQGRFLSKPAPKRRTEIRRSLSLQSNFIGTHTTATSSKSSKSKKHRRGNSSSSSISSSSSNYNVAKGSHASTSSAKRTSTDVQEEPILFDPFGIHPSLESSPKRLHGEEFDDLWPRQVFTDSDDEEDDEDDGDDSILLHWTRRYNNWNEKHSKFLNSSLSFETEDTASEATSISSYDEAAAAITAVHAVAESTNNNINNKQRRLRWVDQLTPPQPLTTVHDFKNLPPLTIRVVILLVMNDDHSKNPFEFIHCEYNVEERLRTADCLQQISAIMGREKGQKFTALFYEQREMINALALQDYEIPDGKGVLIAVGSDRKLLKTAEAILSDKTLKREIRKARLSGQCLHVLSSSAEWRERQKNPCTKESSQNDEEDVPVFSSNIPSSPTSPRNAAISRMFVNFDDKEFGSFSFDEYDNDDDDETSDKNNDPILEWLKEDFFVGQNLFFNDDKSNNRSPIACDLKRHSATDNHTLFPPSSTGTL